MWSQHICLSLYILFLRSKLDINSVLIVWKLESCYTASDEIVCYFENAKYFGDKNIVMIFFSSVLQSFILMVEGREKKRKLNVVNMKFSH
jgi:hypothetical protein